jgi:hypothetical protein
MKNLPAIILFIFIFISGCDSKRVDDENRGAQADQDMPSNRDNEIDEHKNDTIILKEGNTGPEADTLSEAPNTGDSQGIQGQSGTNQTGSQNPH